MKFVSMLAYLLIRCIYFRFFVFLLYIELIIAANIAFFSLHEEKNPQIVFQVRRKIMQKLFKLLILKYINTKIAKIQTNNLPKIAKIQGKNSDSYYSARQKLGENSSRMVKTSKRPTSMSKDNSHLAKLGMLSKVPLGPVTPDPGP